MEELGIAFIAEKYNQAMATITSLRGDVAGLPAQVEEGKQKLEGEARKRRALEWRVQNLEKEIMTTGSVGKARRID